jgi:two-component system, NtrC family, nitrogen regulation sensor histidine kinase NtrY
MAFRKFRTAVVTRVLLLVVSMALFMFLLEIDRFRISLVIIGILVVVQVILLIRFVDRTNRKLTHFLESIRHSDFASSFSDPGLGKSFGELSDEFNEIFEAIRKYRAEKEESFNYLQTVVQHVSIGILVFQKDGKVDIYNNAIRKMLRLKHLRDIHDLSVVKEDLPDTFMKLRAGESTLVKVFIESELLQLSINCTEFRMRSTDFVLVSVQDISSELDEKEIESWQKLIRVLTHEITNSITPITSLASTVHEMLIRDEDGKPVMNDLDEEDVESVDKAILTVQKRSQGLLNFVETYRNLTRIPKPNFRYFRVSELFDRCHQLLLPKIEELKISCNSTVFPPDLMITADPDLIDQVIINLMLNAIDAVKEVENPKISILATLNNANRVVIDIHDNGHGIKPDIMDKIFMPFFTSKKHGSGVGLSLSRQIMHLHKGSILVRSKPEDGTVFTLVF